MFISYTNYYITDPPDVKTQFSHLTRQTFYLGRLATSSEGIAGVKLSEANDHRQAQKFTRTGKREAKHAPGRALPYTAWNSLCQYAWTPCVRTRLASVWPKLVIVFNMVASIPTRVLEGSWRAGRTRFTRRNCCLLLQTREGPLWALSRRMGPY